MSTCPRAAALLLVVFAHTIKEGVWARRVAENDGSRAIDWESVVEEFKEIDRTKDTDAFVVYESASDSEFTKVSRPPLNKVSLETFKDALNSCPPKKKICIGYYKVNYPMKVGSSTNKEKGALVMAIGPGLGIAQKMPVTKFVWPPLRKQLSDAGVAPNAFFELNGADKINKFGIEVLWKEIAAKSTRVETPEIESFKVHGEKQIADAINGGPIAAISTVPDTKDDSEPAHNDHSASNNPSQTGGQVGVAVDPKMIEDLVARKMKAVEEKVEKIVEDKASELAQKAAQDEVGRAIRKLGNEVQDAYTSVGKMWIDKAKS